MKSKERKHLTLDDRLVIQACLLERMNMTEIASRLHVHKSTISRELKNNSVHKLGTMFPVTKSLMGFVINAVSMGTAREKEFITTTKKQKE